jgi:hypothetical protein
MTGWRLPMAHDPFSLVLNRTRPAHFTLTLPRIEGVVEGADVRGSGGQRYAGRVVITQLKMEVELYDVDGGERHALPWNGEYTLVYKDASR